MDQLIDKFAEAGNIAVIGASNKAERYGSKIYKKLKRMGFNVFPINPNYEHIDGDKAYKCIDDIDENIDCVSVVVNPERGREIIKHVIDKGVSIAWFQPGAYDSHIIDTCKANDLDCIYGRCVLVEL